MSDDDFGDDSFLIDDSFLREVDHITASASVPVSVPSHPSTAGPTVSFGRSTSLAAPATGRGWTGIQRSHSGPSSRHDARPNAAGQAARKAALSGNAPRFPPHPSSDDYDLSIPAESLAAFDSLTSASRLGLPAQPTSSSSRPTSSLGGTIPSSRLGVGRSQNANSGFLQTHLNFRRDKQSTKGKRWDRTEFAESGRRIGAEKGKGKGKAAPKGKRKGREWDEEEEEMEDEDDWGDVMAPAPVPLVDINAPYEAQRHLPNSATIGSYIYPTNRPKRDYQFDIVQACFTDNCLVALPTGLGKTFVAGVVMLNFFRWFPTGKIVFLAPTRPLVNQQIEACQLSCGIPSKDAAVMTGASVSAKERARLWEERRVFYCTPQTLDNDLKKGSVDPRDIVLAVFDEAHKASGSYAYTTILAYLTAHHPYFRVLALTATPGADVPRVQAVVDALHISRIEIREAEAPEIRKYMNEKHTEKHFVQMGDVIEGFRDRWAALMKPYVAKLVEKDILTERDLDTKRLRPFRLTAKRMEIARDRNSGLKWCFGALQSLEKMARAMGNLLEFSLGMFHTTISEIAGGTDSTGKKSHNKGSANSIRNNYEFQKLLRDVEAEMNMIRIGKDGRSKADRHPKMVKTLELARQLLHDLLLEHFSQAEEEEKTLGQKNDTRAMVFCSYRDCVLEVVDMLNQHSGLLRATKFVGQSQGKQEEDKGFNQKEQKKTINEFKDGKYNILVSTSIGEEGLDIGEVDFVVIYDMPKQSIKLLQRIGRTGRKRDGKVHVLMSEGREDANWDTAQQTHREIQEEILHSRNLELFEDVEPLLPGGRVPQCVEQEMEIDPWDPGDKTFRKELAGVEKYVRKEKERQAGTGIGTGASAKGKTKAKATAAKEGTGKSSTGGRRHEVPEGAGGFRSVADLLRDAGRLQDALDEDEQEEEEQEQEEIERPKAQRGKAAPRTSTSAPKKRRGKRPVRVLSESESDDEKQDLDSLFAVVDTTQEETVSKSGRGETKSKTSRVSAGSNPKSTIKQTRGSSAVAAREKKKREVEEEEEERRRAEGEELNRSALDFFNTQGPIRRSGQEENVLTPPSSPLLPLALAPTADRDRPLVPPSPSPEREPAPALVLDSPLDRVFESPIHLRKDQTTAANKLTPRTAAMAGFSQVDIDIDLSWDGDLDADANDDEDTLPLLESAKSKRAIVNVNHTPPTAGSMAPPPVPLSASSYSRKPLAEGRLNDSPLFLPSSSPFATSHANETSTPLPPTQFPIRRGLGLRRPRPVLLSSAERSQTSPQEVVSPFANLRARAPLAGAGRGLEEVRGGERESSEPDSPVVAAAAARNRRTARRAVAESSSPPAAAAAEDRRRVNRRERRNKVSKKVNQFLDMDASLSGSASPTTSEHSSSSEANSSDNAFAGNFQPTQAPRGYNQHAAYRAGLGTQAAGHGLHFKRDKAVERDEFLRKARKAVYVTDDEDDRTGRGGGGGGGSSENEYELGSFVVDDDEDMGFMSQSDPLSFS